MGENAIPEAMQEYIERGKQNATRANANIAHHASGFMPSANRFGDTSVADGNFIWVTASNQVNESGKVILWERDSAHPGPDHEIFIGANTAPILVARTRAVDDHLGRGNLVITEESSLKEFHLEGVRRQRAALKDELKRTGDAYRLEAEAEVEAEEGGVTIQQLAAQVEAMHTGSVTTEPEVEEIKRRGRPPAAPKES